jgi:hypothetical protein
MKSTAAVVAMMASSALALSTMTSLTIPSIHQAIDKTTRSDASIQQELNKRGLVLRRATESKDWISMLGFVKKGDKSTLDAAIPTHFGMMLQKTNEAEEIFGVVTFYMAYSTWDGRILYVDRLECSEMDHDIETLLHQTLADIAVQLDCSRLTWRVRR